jgi:hypothetical protein
MQQLKGVQMFFVRDCPSGMGSGDFLVVRARRGRMRDRIIIRPWEYLIRRPRWRRRSFMQVLAACDETPQGQIQSQIQIQIQIYSAIPS